VNVQEYISSGILESYALGSCSTQEVTEVERLMTEHDSIRNEVYLIQGTLEQVAARAVIAPPAYLKTQIWDAIREESVPIFSLVQEDLSSATDLAAGKKPWLSWTGYVASLAVIVASTAFALYFYRQNERMESQLAAVSTENSALSEANLNTSESLKNMTARLKVMAAADTRKVTLAGVPASPDSKAVVFWNAASQQVMLTGIALPKAPADKQYQLWALVDGVPVDAGIFDDTDTTGVFTMKSIGKSQAFAITLEPKGGSASPHLDMLCVIGNV